MSYTTHAHNLFGNLSFQPSPDLQLFASTLWHKGAAGIDPGSLALDPSGLPKQPLGMNYALLSEAMDGFSSIEIRRFTQAVGFNWKIDDRWLLHGMAEYDDYDDRDPYLFSVDGRHFFVQTGVMLVF